MPTIIKTTLEVLSEPVHRRGSDPSDGLLYRPVPEPPSHSERIVVVRGLGVDPSVHGPTPDRRRLVETTTGSSGWIQWYPDDTLGTETRVVLGPHP